MTQSPAVKLPLGQRINFRVLIFAAVLLCLVGAPVYWYVDTLVNPVKTRGDLKEVDLKWLSDFPFDQNNGTMDDVPAEARALHGQRVLLYGEMWSPYSAGSRVAGFDLVYSISKCCLSGPPQIQHFIQSKVLEGRSVDFHSGLVKVVGTLHVEVQKSGGRVSRVFRLDVESVEPT